MTGQTPPDVEELADRLDEAAAKAAPIPRLAAAAGVGPAAAYAVQEALVERRLARGERLVGLKMGLTSRAKMAQVGVDEVIWGRLTDGMRVDDGGLVDLGRYIHPRVEPEVAFLMSRSPEPGEPVGDLASAVRAVAPAIELIDSRYDGFSFSLPDVIADNTSAAGFVVGPWRPVPDGLDNLGVLLEVGGRVVQTGSTAAILGDPRRALDAAVRLAGRRGVRLREGWVVLAGAATAAVPLRAGDHVRAVVERLGTASLRAAS
ncbi:fumarylacetoacetate hydrolase family protein [Microbispora corallina]|uniref:4-oxalocrotonate decarboxylase n=1 Tax=Microbispora corallina TaxID=83302 RepID=A0ABQ4G0V9_9ACTN|nr:fumarylacetoacetate hydrolase family protein [Microbispora corallina]GIH40708.1 4-oxalocrotonate decarboxylase [Microbispora corallina]